MFQDILSMLEIGRKLVEDPNGFTTRYTATSSVCYIAVLRKLGERSIT